MKFLLITLAAGILTFLFDVVFRKTIEKRPFKVHGFKVHHSVLGAFLFIVGIIFGNVIISAIGLGMYLSHVGEEMYFEKTKFTKAFLVFITR